MKQLQLGFISNQDLADWFGIKEKSFKNVKSKKLEELKSFADFESSRSGVNIKEIYNSTYTKKGSKAKQIVENNFDEEWNEDGADTSSNVARKIYNHHKDELGVAETTTYNYTLLTRDKLYGKPFSDIKGLLGRCSYEWRKKYISENGEEIYTPFTEEENKIKEKLLTKYFGTSKEKEIMLSQMVESGELSKEQAWDIHAEMGHLNNAGFLAFKADLETTIGSQIGKVTVLDRDRDKINFLNERSK